ncbi:hypothetical protein [Arthrobacter koreensis]|uniref:hypothetical protein n=1 Tax=Arthrobacter koreensis TaxID=199136 RepID=UPI00382D392D
MAHKKPKDIPGVYQSKVVPTEYDVSRNGLTYVLNDDRGRTFTGRTFTSALRRAERAQDPNDPIHHEPYPHPSDTPLP